jgi:hypothetical protein
MQKCQPLTHVIAFRPVQLIRSRAEITLLGLEFSQELVKPLRKQYITRVELDHPFWVAIDGDAHQAGVNL